MPDIDQATVGEQVIFSAKPGVESNWMMQNYSSLHIVYSTPDETDDVLEFRAAAKAAGLVIAHM